MTDDEIADVAARMRALNERIHAGKTLLCEWRDKYGGREHYTFVNTSGMKTASPTDLASATQRWIEGR